MDKTKNMRLLSLPWIIFNILVIVCVILLCISPIRLYPLTAICIVLSVASITSLGILIKYSFLKSAKWKQLINNSSYQVQEQHSKKMYIYRFVVNLLTPVIGFVTFFYLSMFILDGIFGGLWFLSGGGMICLAIALILAGVTLVFISYNNVKKINNDFSLNTYPLEDMWRSTKKIMYISRIYAIVIIISLSFFIIYSLGSPLFAYGTEYSNSQKVKRNKELVSYSNGDEMISSYLDTINRFDSDGAIKYYYPGQNGNSVMLSIEGLITSVKNEGKLTRNSEDYYLIRKDDKNNSYYYVGADFEHNMGTDIEVIHESKTNNWFVLGN